MISWLRFFVIALLAAQCGFAQAPTTQKSGSPPDEAASQVPAGEAHFNSEQLKEYYLVYKNADVHYLREIFDSYSHRGHGTSEEFELLRKWDSDYYRSKFVVFSRSKNPFGGTLIKIMFQRRPDRVFTAWIYPEGAEEKLTLRAFEPDKFSEEDIKQIRIRYRQFLEDKEHAM